MIFYQSFFLLKNREFKFSSPKKRSTFNENATHMNWPVIIIVGIILLALVVFLVKRNIKDEKEVEQQLKEDYPRPRDEGDEEENIEEMK